MKRHSYGQLIGMSWQWMSQILFRPFSLKKWIMLGIIILLAGQMGGFNFNASGDKSGFEKFINTVGKKASVTDKEPAPLEAPIILKAPNITGKTVDVSVLNGVVPRLGAALQMPSFNKNPRQVILIILVVGVIILFVSVFILLWMWVNANFSFVFIDSIMRNDASLRTPFHRNKARGNSYFRWNIVFSSIALLTFGVIISLPIIKLIKARIFTGAAPINAARIFSILMPYVPVLLAAGIIFFLISFFTWHFVLPIMYKKKIGILSAWAIFLRLFRRNIGNILLYLLVKFGLTILALIAVIILAILGIMALLIIIGLLGLLGWLIYTITPCGAKHFILVLLIIIGIPILGFLGFLFNLVFIPIAIFFRIFSIYVLGNMDESLDLFAAKTLEEIEAEGDDGKYKKSMALVWFTVLAPVLVAIIALLLAIAIPNLLKAGGGALQKWQSGIKEIWPFKKTSSEPDSLSDEIALPGKIVTVYLKNGNSFKAVIESETEYNISFRIKGGTFILPRSDILRIE